MATLIPPPVDEDGNISFNRVEGITLPIREKDNSGGWVDISGAQRYFSMFAGGFRKSLDLDPDNAEGRRLLLTTAELAGISSTAPFAITDEDGLVPVVIWEGTIYERIAS